MASRIIFTYVLTILYLLLSLTMKCQFYNTTNGVESTILESDEERFELRDLLPYELRFLGFDPRHFRGKVREGTSTDIARLGNSHRDYHIESIQNLFPKSVVIRPSEEVAASDSIHILLKIEGIDNKTIQLTGDFKQVSLNDSKTRVLIVSSARIESLIVSETEISNNISVINNEIMFLMLMGSNFYNFLFEGNMIFESQIFENTFLGSESLISLDSFSNPLSVYTNKFNAQRTYLNGSKHFPLPTGNHLKDNIFTGHLNIHTLTPYDNWVDRNHVIFDNIVGDNITLDGLAPAYIFMKDVKIEDRFELRSLLQSQGMCIDAVNSDVGKLSFDPNTVYFCNLSGYGFNAALDTLTKVASSQLYDARIEDRVQNNYQRMLDNLSTQQGSELYTNLHLNMLSHKYQTSNATFIDRMYFAFWYNWWGFGYHKYKVLIWTCASFLLFTYIMYHKLGFYLQQVYTIPQLVRPFKRLTPLRGKYKYVAGKMLISFMYTAIIFFGLKLNSEYINYNHPASVFSLISIYLVGLFCCTYILSLII